MMLSNAAVDPTFWKGKRVLLTGHTGFKGSWMSIWLKEMGAELTGFALPPPTEPSLFEDARVADGMRSVIGDAAQPLVRESYQFPVETYAINVMGTVHVLEAVRQSPGVRAVVVVTTDKCYENKEWVWGYRENEPMGGYDPYSNSKGCAELVTSAYRSSYFHPAKYDSHKVAAASARAGNVIGGGDWATDRLIPDIVRSVIAGTPVQIRSPYAVRPWQHVLEPVSAYLTLAQKLFVDGAAFAQAWNIGPRAEDARDVEYIVQSICNRWGDGASYQIDAHPQPHEAGYLKLDISKIESQLGWHPSWPLSAAIEETVFWYKSYAEGKDVLAVCLSQLEKYIHDSTRIISQ
jgi:CDP-glucose 4,6-dehydratase